MKSVVVVGEILNTSEVRIMGYSITISLSDRFIIFAYSSTKLFPLYLKLIIALSLCQHHKSFLSFCSKALTRLKP